MPRLKDGKVVIPHGMRETLLLRHMGFDVPNPLLKYYRWGRPPFKAQVATFKLLTEHTHAYVLNDMGTGKTWTALSAWDALNRAGLAGRLLVVAPLSTLYFVWKREISQFFPHRKAEVLHGTREQRIEALGRVADIYIINHDGLRTILDALSTRIDVTALILDELAVYRNNSDRSKTMRKFARRFQTVWGMTGAPMPNEPTDVWGQAMIVTPTTVPKYRRQARDLLMTQVSQYLWKPKADAIPQAFKMLQPSVRYSLDDVTELPPVIQRTVDVDLTVEQIDIYNKIRTLLATNIRGKQITALNAGVALQKLIQVGGGWVYTKHPDFVKLDATTRVGALVDLVNSANRKVLVAVPYRHMIDGISEVLRKLDIEHCTVHGDTINRDHIFNLFQNTDKYKVMLAHPATVHHGLTLTAADTTIWYVPIPSLDIYDQFNARIRRIGQGHKQQVIHLAGTPTDRKLYKLLLTKANMQDTLLELLEEATEEAV